MVDLTFYRWAELMDKVYIEGNGKIGVAYSIMSLFRDIIFEENEKTIPLLYNFGNTKTGKSQFTKSIACLCGCSFEYNGITLDNVKISNLRDQLTSKENTLFWIDEYYNDSLLALDTIDVLLEVANGQVKKNETEYDNSKPSIIICSQELPTKDISLISYSISNKFTGNFGNKELFILLKKYEKTNLIPTIANELLVHKELIKNNYKNCKSIVITTIEKAITKKKLKINNRILQHIYSLLIPIIILQEKGKVKLPFNYKEILEELVNRLYEFDTLLNKLSLEEYDNSQEYCEEDKAMIEHIHTIIQIEEDLPF